MPADGSAATTYTNWKDGQPDGASSSQYCIALTTDGKWEDQYCKWYYAKPVICKKGIESEWYVILVILELAKVQKVQFVISKEAYL